MQIITGFDSGAPEEKEKKLLGAEYVQVLKALEHNLEIAENAFARLAKAQIREQVDHRVQRIRFDEMKEGVTQWFAETSVAISSLDFKCYDEAAVGQVLAELVYDFGSHLLDVVGDKTLVDSLNVRIMRVGEAQYLFRLKQRWADNG